MDTQNSQTSQEEKPSYSLLDMYNKMLIDFVRHIGLSDYEPVDNPKKATHYLRPTSWNEEKNYKPNSSGKIVMMDGYATSVCAEPIVIRYKQTTLKIRARWPKGKNAPVYNKNGSVQGKRRVLMQLAELLRLIIKEKKKISKYTDKECDILYAKMVRAYRLRIAQRRANKMEKLKLAALQKPSK